MYLRIFYFAVFCLGATVGALHALSLSPLSSAVLQILGTIAAGSLGILANNEKSAPGLLRIRQTLPALSAVIFAVLLGYWGAWWVTKEVLIARHALSATMPEMSAKERLDAYRLTAVARSLGIPRDVVEARISELVSLPEFEQRRELTPQEEARIIARLGLEAGNCQRRAPDTFQTYFEEIIELGDDANGVLDRLLANNWTQQYLDLRANTLLMPLPLDAPTFSEIMLAAGCNHNEQAKRQFLALDANLSGKITTIQHEIDRLLASSPDINTNFILRNPDVDNETLR